MKFARLERTEFALAILLNGGSQLFVKAWRVEPYQRQVGRERALVWRDALRVERAIDVSCEQRQVSRGNQSCPKNAGMIRIWEKPEPLKPQIDWCSRVDRRECAANAIDLCRRHFADEFKRHVKILLAHPARPLVRQLRGQITHVF